MWEGPRHRIGRRSAANAARRCSRSSGAERALAAIPSKLAAHVSGVGIAVEDMPDDETLEELGIDSAWELTGLYRGTPLTRRSVDDVARQPDLIFLYREPILLEWIELGFGSLSEERLAIVAATLLVLGIQVIFASFLLSILGLRRK